MPGSRMRPAATAAAALAVGLATAVVAFADVSDERPGPGLTGSPGELVYGVLATFESCDFNASSGVFRATVEWGDGTDLDQAAVGGAERSDPDCRDGTRTRYEVRGQHRYSAPGQYGITVRVANTQAVADNREIQTVALIRQGTTSGQDEPQTVTADIDPAPRATIRPAGGRPYEVKDGARIDATRVPVEITTEGPGGVRQTGTFSRGVFVLDLTTPDRWVELRLAGTLGGCVRRGGSPRAAAAQSRGRVRRLFGRAKGRFRIRGRFGSAAVRGTRWSVTDLCQGTRVQVSEGRVTAAGFVRLRTQVVPAGASLFIKAGPVNPRRVDALLRRTAA